MEFQQLEMFAAVVEEGSVHRAAERVYRTGPAVSIALRKLEEEIGSPLFDRSKRHDYSLTPSGKLLYSYAVRILRVRNEAVSALKELSHCKRGSLSIGTHESASLYLLPLLTQPFHKIHPTLRIEVVSEDSEGVLRALRDRHIDLALVAITPDEPELEMHLIMQDELVLITSPDHQLATVQEVHVRDLANEFLILEGNKSSLYQKVIDAFRDSEISLNVSVENVTIETIKRMVLAGDGVGFVPLMCVREEEARGELVTIRVDGVTYERDLWLIHRKDRPLSHAARAFVEVSVSVASSWKLTSCRTSEECGTRAPSNGRSQFSKTIRPGVLSAC